MNYKLTRVGEFTEEVIFKFKVDREADYVNIKVYEYYLIAYVGLYYPTVKRTWKAY